MKRLFFLSILIFSLTGYSQINEIKQFPHPVSSGKFKASHLLFNNNTYYMFYYDSLNQADTGTTRLMVSKSTDGINWNSGLPLSSLFNITRSALDLTACTFQNKIVVIFKGSGGFNYMVTSVDGTNWSTMIRINFSDDTTQMETLNYSMTSDADSIYLSGSTQWGSVFRIVSSNDLLTWNYWTVNIWGSKNGSMIVQPGLKIFFYEQGGKILRRSYPLSPAVELLPASYNASYPRGLKTPDGTIWVAFNKLKYIGLVHPVYDIYYIKSTDNMVTWSQPEQFTSYAGLDSLRSISAKDNLPLVSFFSTRNSLYSHDKNLSLNYGILSQSLENNNDPVIKKRK